MPRRWSRGNASRPIWACLRRTSGRSSADRKSTRLNSSHLVISYAVFCLKKKKKLQKPLAPPAFAALALCIGLEVLAFEAPAYAAQLMVLPQLLAITGHAACAFLSLLPRR